MKYITLSLLILFGNFQLTFASQTYTPDWPDFVVEKWEITTPTYISTTHIAELIQEAKYPGNSANFSLVKDLLQQHKLKDTSLSVGQAVSQETIFLYHKAVVAQYFHQFEASNALLNKVIKQKPNHTNAILLKSNMHLLLGEYKRALQTCARLIGLADQAIVAACGNYAKAQNGNVKENLNSLMGFLKNQKVTNNEVSVYLAEIQASLAKETGDLVLASAILRPFEHWRVPVSFWVLWADIQISLNYPENVLAILGSIVRQTKNKDDALLLRLAIAEKQVLPSKKIWLPQAKTRIALRERRQDNEHASDIALYYYYIKEDAETAHKWAKINWQQAKLREDANLLDLTQNAMNAPLAKISFLPQLNTHENRLK